MSDAIKVGFVPLSSAARGILVVFCDEGLKLGPATVKALGGAGELVKRAASAAGFKGKSGAALDILAPEGVKATRLVVIGSGKARMLEFGVADETAWQVGLSCGGRIKVYVERLG